MGIEISNGLAAVEVERVVLNLSHEAKSFFHELAGQLEELLAHADDSPLKPSGSQKTAAAMASNQLHSLTGVMLEGGNFAYSPGLPAKEAQKFLPYLIKSLKKATPYPDLTASYLTQAATNATSTASNRKAVLAFKSELEKECRRLGISMKSKEVG